MRYLTLTENVFYKLDNGIAGSFLLDVREGEIAVVVFQPFVGFNYLLVVLMVWDVTKNAR